GMKKPVASPPRNWNTNSVGRFGAKGSMSDMTANAPAAPIRALRVPKITPSQMETKVTNIWATVWDVVIQEPSSNPACRAQRMSARPREESRVLSVEMKVPNRTPVRPSQGKEVAMGGMAGGGVGPGAAGGSLIGAHPSACPPWPPLTSPAE